MNLTPHEISFNSLQTGKSFRTGYTSQAFAMRKKFQFPSNGKVLSDTSRCLKKFEQKTSFQFPSNGKVLSDIDSGENYINLKKFQFPSNGKVLSDCSKTQRTADQPSVSIPFKRESPFGHRLEADEPVARDCFNSLQTGKSFRTYNGEDVLVRPNEFQFPSNGKVLSDQILIQQIKQLILNVSIPFKRESPFGQPMCLLKII